MCIRDSNLAVLFTQGIKCLPIAAVVVTLTIIVCYAIARKLGVDPMLAILTAGGTGICGAAAVMGLAGSIKVPEDKQDEKDNDVTLSLIHIYTPRRIIPWKPRSTSSWIWNARR